ncbi:MAG: serine hydrolase [Clostridia bacterium]|nr:serine hydrolase [Clostridia bacterium]
MDIFKKKAIELVMGLAITEKKDPSVVPFIPSKVSVSGEEKKYFRRKIGGPAHKYSARLSELISRLEAERAANVHSIIVIKDNEVILEASAPGYSVNVAHLAHSMSKTVCAIAIGMLVDDGKLTLDEHIIDFFPELPFSDIRFSEITVEDLLTMRSGVPFGEIGTVTSEDWCESFFSTELAADPGCEFHYNSMNSYIMAKIVTRITGKSVTEFITPRLLSPLSIDNFLWEKAADGTEKGGFGIYLSCESFAKIGVMLLSRGSFEGQRILSEDFVKKMTSTHAITPESIGAFNYGYHVWTSREGDEFLLSGMLGQNVWVCPSQGIVVALNSGNNEIFQDSAALEIVRAVLSDLDTAVPATRAEHTRLKSGISHFFERRHWIRPLTPKRGLAYFLGIKDKRPYDSSWDAVLGEYSFPENNTSLLPLFVSVLQNNYIGGIESLSLSREGNGLLLSTTEGGVRYDIPVGLYDFCTSVQNYRGELYTVRAIAEAMEDEDRVPVYKIELIFPELPNTRAVKITHTADGIMLRLSEMPNQRVADRFISGILKSGKMAFAMSIFGKAVGEDFLEKRLTSVFNPTLLGTDTRHPECESIVNERNLIKAESQSKNGKLIKTVISKFIGEERSDDSSEKKQKKPKEKKRGEGFLKRAISSILQKRRGSDVPVTEYTEIHVAEGDAQDESGTPMLPPPDEKSTRADT